tara:strand:- start:54 stop:239 length:186 start_codon:yes stop_codon:yes gene_type:complete
LFFINKKQYSEERKFGGIFQGRYNETQLKKLNVISNFVVVHNFSNENECRQYLKWVCQQSG